ncbi:MAG: porin [Phycisphaerales bacterium]|nr:porin [Phycisphaerales bacterium]
MVYRKSAVLAVVASVLANAGFALADDTAAPLSLRTVVTADATIDVGPDGLLMQGLDKIGVGDPFRNAGINVYGWLEVGYTYDTRSSERILPGPFNLQVGNHFMFNQLALRFERDVKSDQFDVGGMVELMFGTDAAQTRAKGPQFDRNGDPTHRNGSIPSYSDSFSPQHQLDLVQAYVDVNVPVGNGLKLRAGKFVSFLGYETSDPRFNPFYSHSYLFAQLPFSFTGLVGYYQFNEQWSAAGGFTRGWNQFLRDNNSALNVVGQVGYAPNRQWSTSLNFTFGPENDFDNSHYRTTIDFVAAWQVTEELKLGMEALYIYDGGGNRELGSDETHAFGVLWGTNLYASYTINEYITANARLGFTHYNLNNDAYGNREAQDFRNVELFGWAPLPQPTNVWDLTLGVTVKPFPRDPIGKNLIVRPEIRYSYADIQFFEMKDGRFVKDQFTIAIDAVFSF